MYMQKVLVICGQTATGKSDLAVFLAQQLQNCEIISADSRQIYKQLDIGSNKITANEMCSVPHHLLDVIQPKQRFTVADYQAQARNVINELLSTNKTPIVCGGTGLYIDSALFNDYTFTTDSNRSNTNNRHDGTKKREFDLHYKNSIWIGLWAPREFLQAKIRARATLKFDAVINEVTNLLAHDVSKEWLYGLGLEYTFALDVIDKKITKEEYIELLTTKTWQYAKRQMTWFKRNNNIMWFDISTNDYETIMRSISGLMHVSAS